MGDAPPKKKLPFKPTALRNKAAAASAASAAAAAAAAPKPTPTQDGEKVDDDGLDLFRQSGRMAPILAAQQEKSWRKKQKQLEEQQRRRSIAEGKRPMDAPPLGRDAALVDPETQDLDWGEVATQEKKPEEPPADESMAVARDSFTRDPVTPPPSKRWRHDSEGSRSSKRQRSEVNILEDACNESPLPSKRSSRSQQSPVTNAITPSRKTKPEAVTPSGAPLIELLSDSEDDKKPAIMETLPEQREDSIEAVEMAAPELPETQVEEEDEFAEYVRKAEAQRARDKAMLQPNEDGSSRKEAAEIMVTSTVPNAHVAYVKYQFNRPLRLVRDSWIALQRRKGVELPITQDDDIILTWQRRKVYTTSTLLSLGIRPQSDGRIKTDRYEKGGLVDGRSKVHLEAWTAELFKEMELEVERRQKKNAGELSSEDEEEEPAEEQVKLRVRLLARGMEEVKLTVLMETTVETLVNGFRRQRDVSSDKDVSIWFDGEKLEEHDTMDLAGIDDMDSLEVHIK